MITLPRLIGLTGPAGSGKDTAAHYLVTRHGCRSYALADPIRAGLMAMLGLVEEDFERPAKEQTIGWLGTSPRHLMQTLGTQWGRRCIADDLWLRLAERELRQARAWQVALVIRDVRFDNEARWVRAHGGRVWHIMGRRAEGVRPHESEAGARFAAGDVALDNSGTPEQMFEFIDAALEALAP